jgi:hypothetical protein
MLGKTCRLCVVCDVLIAHEHEVTPLLMTSVADLNAPPQYVVLGTVETRIWRSGMTRGVTLEAVKESMADFKQYLRIEVMPGGWSAMGTIRRGDERTGSGAARRTMTTGRASDR